MSDAPAQEERPLGRAGFLDRFVAFSFDYFLILALSYAALFAAGRAIGPSAAASNPLLIGWLAAWLVLFLLYHAALSSGGRSTLGKKLFGVQVFTTDGYPLDFSKALIRSTCYVVSSLLFGLGFLWALWDKEKKAWHDKIAGTMVLETREKTALAKVGVALAALVFLAGDAALVLWPLAAPHYYDMQVQANASRTVSALATFEDAYKKRSGTYTADLNELGKVYGNPDEFMTLLGQAVLLPSVQIQADKDHYHIVARARDAEATAFEISGP